MDDHDADAEAEAEEKVPKPRDLDGISYGGNSSEQLSPLLASAFLLSRQYGVDFERIVRTVGDIEVGALGAQFVRKTQFIKTP